MPERGTALRKMRRVASMPLREMTHRLREKGYSQLQRLGVPLGNWGMPSIDPKTWFADAPLRRFYPGVIDSDRAYVSAHFPEWVNRAKADAERICSHEFQLLGFPPVTLGREINWHRDPYSNRDWEVRFWASYKAQDDLEGRDAKVIHEFNRHQHLPRLAKAWLWTGDEKYAEEAVAQMLGWIEQNPVGMGINWQSSLELAIRCVSWIWTIFPLLHSRAFDQTAAETIAKSLFAQIQHIARHLSTYTSPNTHLIGEAATLFLAGLLFGEHGSAADWLATGAAVLNKEVKNQVLDGAVYGELSSWYHCYTVDFYLQAVVLAQQNHRDLSSETEMALENMLEYLMHLTRPDGTIPLLGDDDGGRALALARRDYRSFHEALAIGAVLFNRPDFKQQARPFPEEAFWLLGRKGLETYQIIEPEIPATWSKAFLTAGYVLQRTGWDPGASHLIFDCGGLGILTGGHAHADSLSLNLFSGGRELLVDPGTYVYNCQPEWRAYFRSTAAHNTVTVDGRNQTETAGTFAWRSALVSRASFQTLQTILGSESPQRVEWMEGEHDGYSAINVSHRRSVMSAPGGYWIVLDRFRGSGSHCFDFHYHFGPETNPEMISTNADGTEVRATDCAFALAIYGSSPLESALESGWASRSYGEQHATPALRTTMSADIAHSGAAAITLLIPGGPAPRIRRLTLDAGHGIACAIDRDGLTEVSVFNPEGGEVKVAGARMTGEFFWMRCQRCELQSSLAVRATSFEYDGINLLEEAMCAQSAAF
jgi:hypothetical protein